MDGSILANGLLGMAALGCMAWLAMIVLNGVATVSGSTGLKRVSRFGRLPELVLIGAIVLIILSAVFR